MAVNLIDNLYQIGGGELSHPRDGASYALIDFRNPEKSIAIDCGSELGIDTLKYNLARASLGLVQAEDITKILGTHCHYDHVAAAEHFAHASLYIHTLDRTAVETGDPDLTALFLYEQDGIREFPHVSRLDSVEDGQVFEVGETRITALHTPGHTPGSVSYRLTMWNGITVLAAGDTLWGGYQEELIHSNKDDWSNSLDRLSNEKFDYVTFGHGVTRLVLNAMDHIDKAKAWFIREGEVPLYNDPKLQDYYNPWRNPKEQTP